LGGFQTVKVKARCSIHTDIESEWSGELIVQIEIVTGPDVPMVTGAIPLPLPPPWVSGTIYTFTATGSISTLNHTIQYIFEWGDGTYSNWIDSASGEQSLTLIFGT